MPPKCGIIGLPNVGKSTFFSSLAKRQGLSANFPFSTIEPNIGIVPVPDHRLTELNKYVSTQQIIPTTVSFVDIAGLVKGASQGEGLGNQFLANIREVDALVHVVRCFDNDNIIHVAGSVDPVFDQEVIHQELRLADIASLTKKREKVAKLAKTGKQEALQQQALLDKLIPHIESGNDVRTILLSPQEQQWITTWHLLTSKPIMYVANIDENTLAGNPSQHLQALKQAVQNNHAHLLPICLDLEAQIVALPQQEQQAYLEAYGLAQTSLTQIIQTVYNLLGLITYFTVGPQEIRAWTVAKETAAPQAAGVIHTDFEKNFIKAEVMKYTDFIQLQSEEACRQAGKIAIEGKNYIVQDGDIIHFKC